MSERKANVIEWPSVTAVRVGLDEIHIQIDGETSKGKPVRVTVKTSGCALGTLAQLASDISTRQQNLIRDEQRNLDYWLDKFQNLKGTK